MASSLTDALGNREALVRTGKRLQYFTIAWNSVEALVAIISGLVAGSIALVGFGFDSVIEVTSGAAVLWRMHKDDSPERERIERVTLRIVGICFLALAGYISFESLRSFVQHQRPDHSLVGVILAIASLFVMPLLSRSKRRVGRLLNSEAMKADATQTQFCTYLSAILLIGLGANWALGWWWADPAAALAMVPLIGREGWESLHHRQSC